MLGQFGVQGSLHQQLGQQFLRYVVPHRAPGLRVPRITGWSARAASSPARPRGQMHGRLELRGITGLSNAPLGRTVLSRSCPGFSVIPCRSTVYWSPTGIKLSLETRMNARFRRNWRGKYRQKYRQNTKCPPFFGNGQGGQSAFFTKAPGTYRRNPRNPLHHAHGRPRAAGHPPGHRRGRGAG